MVRFVTGSSIMTVSAHAQCKQASKSLKIAFSAKFQTYKVFGMPDRMAGQI